MIFRIKSAIVLKNNFIANPSKIKIVHNFCNKKILPGLFKKDIKAVVPQRSIHKNLAWFPNNSFLSKA